MKKTCFYKPKALFACLLFIAGCLLFSSCTQLNVFEKDITIPNYKWESNFMVQGKFAITDTADYNIYLVLRHTDAYKYDNIWLNIGLKAPGDDSLHYQKRNLELGNDAKGWEGSGMNDIWEVRKVLNDKPLSFKKAGTYEFNISQIMRDNPLPNIMSAGLRLERIKD